MSEVALLQIIGLCVVGIGILILLFIKGMFLRVVGFVSMILGTFSLIALGVPQMASLPPAIETFDIASVKSPSDLAAIGQKIFFSKGQCALCHSIGPSESARCPDLAGIGAKLAPDFIYESLTQPQAYIYLDFRHEGRGEWSGEQRENELEEYVNTGQHDRCIQKRAFHMSLSCLSYQ